MRNVLKQYGLLLKPGKNNVMEKPLISIVSPVYRAEAIVELLVDLIKKSIMPVTDRFEIILVEDGSPDKSWEQIREISKQEKRVKGLKLSRNFGQHYAITAGLDYAQGEWVVVMDCDLQDRPEEIPKLFATALTGYDIVLARRAKRKDNFFKKLFSYLFYSVLSYLTGTKQDPAIANFGIYNTKVIAAIQSMRESIRYFPTMVKWVGFRKTSIDVEHGAREVGTSNYNFSKLLKLALDIVLAYSDKPIRLAIKLGMFVAVSSFLFGLFTFYRYLNGEIAVIGYTSLLLSIWFLAGIILIVLGIVGLYIGKTFEGVKNRPIYFLEEQINIEE